MTLSTHLRTILKALGTGGQIPEGRTAVEKIFTAIGERLNRFLLPTPTVTSEGKTMVVQDGVWRMGAIGSIFTVKGSVDTIENLPATGNVVGDVYHVSQNGAEYVWITSTVHPTGYWEQFGYAVDSELSPHSINPVRNSTIASAFDLYTRYLNEKVDVHEPYVFGELLIYGSEDDEPGVGIHSYYNAGSPSLKLYGSENDELVRLTGLANPTANNDAATKQYVDSVAPLQLIATPTDGASGDTFMSGTWRGATWREVMAAVLASRLIQIDVADMGPVTLVYNAFSATSVASTCFAFASMDMDTFVIARVTLYSNSNFTVDLIARADPVVVTDGASAMTCDPQPNTIYKYGKLTSLTISNPTATGKFWIWFTSGATATTVTGIENGDGTAFQPEANKVYKITVEDGYATFDSWSTGGGT